MILFHYTFLLPSEGGKKEDLAEALSRFDLMHRLSEQGILLLSVKRIPPPKGFYALSRAHQLDFVKNLSLFLTHRFPLDESLFSLTLRSQGGVQRLCAHTRHALQQGLSLDKALALYPLDPFLISRLAIAEKTGAFIEGLRSVQHYLEHTQTLKAALRNASVYPLFAIIFIIVVFGSLIKGGRPILQDLSQSGPEFAHLSPLVESLSWIDGDFLILGCVMVFALFWLRILLGRFALYLAPYIPFKGGFYRRSRLELILPLKEVLKAKYPILEGLKTCSSCYPHLRPLIKGIEDSLERGESFQCALKQTCLFKSHHLDAISIGETSGTFVETLENLYDQESLEVLNNTKRLTTWTGPVLTLIMGLMVLWIVSIFFLPLYEHLSHIPL